MKEGEEWFVFYIVWSFQKEYQSKKIKFMLDAFYKKFPFLELEKKCNTTVTNHFLSQRERYNI